jgi:ankyrin repeat protein
MWGDRGPQANKADVEAKDNIAEYGYTPLHWASQKGNEKVAQLLVVRDEGQGRGKMSVYADQGGCVYIGR